MNDLLSLSNYCDELETHSNTPRLYSQWLNSVIYWLLNHCTGWARTKVTSFSRQFDFHDVIYLLYTPPSLYRSIHCIDLFIDSYDILSMHTLPDVYIINEVKGYFHLRFCSKSQ